MPFNQAAWILEKQGKPLVVKESPYVSPGPDQVTIKNGAVAINPGDWKLQDSGMFIEHYPYILGFDLAGTIEEVGNNVKHLKTGDRVCGATLSMTFTKPEMGAFNLYTVCDADVVALIPSSMSFEAAAVLPIGIATASACLYLKEQLNLDYPTSSPIHQGKYVFIWGGSSSVGSCAIQLAVNSGYSVVATASPHNVEYCKSLGAEQVFDYGSNTVVDEIMDFLKGKTLAGIVDAISEGGTVQKCVEVAQKSKGDKIISMVTPGSENGHADDVKLGSVFASLTGKEVATVIYGKFLPKALEDGTIKPKPDPFVIGKGLEHVQAGIDKVKAGVSAAKVVVTL